ncbi:MAG: L-histidine N(alpha)-methyltransferase [Dokdonella sp.]|uniref:L-histidine N(alpha)-methyltransferase n=1 Tax=Dokdonella sp. TaxID=2291710 RepID=UPI002B6EEE0A|nr:L-histidine N(alpha)-methyltransferase [Xanthomonadales bacterium]HQV72571.1 L-histidine N(alpha)-methyltransferase [Dokdonella sp.]MBK7210438.1 L-histidine N(alpha)-methyltransferase [Xanthomonadales bacterium]MBL0223892.1 L-histidine N(alpha)-methyltransferase [Xanthomonadales bacterium]HQW75625.1 L-histidine N(alpha)-methyltransferase [Dokdonella sp.]
MTPDATGETPADAAARASAEFRADVLHGLAQTPKRIPSKYFYDARGSQLFEEICAQPEYYLTRTELAILEENAAAIASAIGPRALLVEYGSGAGIKTRLLLDALDQPVGYVPVEISRSALDASIENLSEEFPEVDMLPVSADFTRPVDLPAPDQAARRTVVFFPGSTLGNFEQREAIGLLRTMAIEMGRQGAALVGIDLQKDPAILEAAYNDAAGVTREFTLNLLTRINRELQADFQLHEFEHGARYNAQAGRIETHVVSRIDQVVAIGAHRFAFAAGEAMLVEYSCKYAPEDFAAMAARAGLRVVRSWSDSRRWFAVQMLERA